MHVLIVGAGIQGLCLARSLDRRGVGVTVFEGAGLPGAGSSLAATRSLHAFLPGAAAGVLRLATLAPAAWDALLDELGPGTAVPSGATCLDRGAGTVSDLVAQLHALGVAIEKRADRPAGLTAWHDPGARLLRAGLIVERLAHQLGRGSVALRARTPVTAVAGEPPRVTLSQRRGLANRDVAGDAVVVAAGTGSAALLPEGGIPQAQPRLVVEATPEDASRPAWEGLPILLDPEGDGAGYLRPPVAAEGDDPGLAGGAPIALGVEASAAGVPGPGELPDKDAARDIAEPLLALAGGGGEVNLDNAETCAYVGSVAAPGPLGPVGPGLWHLGGLGAAGFRLAPVLAEAVADALAGDSDGAALPALLGDASAPLPPGLAALAEGRDGA